METKGKPPFDPKIFLATRDRGRTISKYPTNQIIFSQGDPADSVFYHASPRNPFYEQI
jgi:CRP/FNR family cyclic AMP-dependent transcriptional regulator